ncbi:unnamed protein product [Closterium sp. NIES-54]
MGGCMHVCMQVLRIDRQSLSIVTSLFIVDGRRMVDNLLQRSEETGSKFESLAAEIEALVAAQEADLTVSTIYAAWTGDMAQLQQLLAAGAKADRADYDGRTPLVGPPRLVIWDLAGLGLRRA